MGKFNETLLRLLSVATLFITTNLSLVAQTLPLLEDGKVWTYYQDPSLFGGEAENSQYIYEYLQGYTIVDGKQCYTLFEASDFEGEKYVGTMYEEDGKVYFCPSGEVESPQLLFDYTLQAGDALWEPYENYVVTSVNTIELYGVERRIYGIGEEVGDVPETYWIEGIGSIQGLTSTIFLFGGPSFVRCEKGGDLLYDSDDFFNQLATSIYQIDQGNQGTSSGKLYDLQGRRLDHEPQHGVFIRDGRKYVKDKRQ